jgi:hypothetical protein
MLHVALCSLKRKHLSTRRLTLINSVLGRLAMYMMFSQFLNEYKKWITFGHIFIKMRQSDTLRLPLFPSCMVSYVCVN